MKNVHDLTTARTAYHGTKVDAIKINVTFYKMIIVNPGELSSFPALLRELKFKSFKSPNDNKI